MSLGSGVSLGLVSELRLRGGLRLRLRLTAGLAVDFGGLASWLNKPAPPSPDMSPPLPLISVEAIVDQGREGL